MGQILIDIIKNVQTENHETWLTKEIDSNF